MQLQCGVKEEGKGVDKGKAEVVRITFGVYLEFGVRSQRCNRGIFVLLIM